MATLSVAGIPVVSGSSDRRARSPIYSSTKKWVVSEPARSDHLGGGQSNRH